MSYVKVVIEIKGFNINAVPCEIILISDICNGIYLSKTQPKSSKTPLPILHEIQDVHNVPISLLK